MITTMWYRFPTEFLLVIARRLIHILKFSQATEVVMIIFFQVTRCFQQQKLIRLILIIIIEEI